jgi:chromosome segregation ATPase
VARTQDLDINIKVDLQSDRGLLERIDRRTERMAHSMATITEAVTALAEKMGGLEEDVQRVLQALENEQLSPEAQQAVDALSARFDNLNQELDAAVPPPPGEGPTGPATDAQL